MKKLRIRTLSAKRGGFTQDIGGGDEWGGGGYTCGGSTKGSCPTGYYCVCYQWDYYVGCTLERLLNGYCKTITCECI